VGDLSRWRINKPLQWFYKTDEAVLTLGSRGVSVGFRQEDNLTLRLMFDRYDIRGVRPAGRHRGNS
jgi:hypothetical protein